MMCLEFFDTQRLTPCLTQRTNQSKSVLASTRSAIIYHLLISMVLTIAATGNVSSVGDLASTTFLLSHNDEKNLAVSQSPNELFSATVNGA